MVGGVIIGTVLGKKLLQSRVRRFNLIVKGLDGDRAALALHRGTHSVCFMMGDESGRRVLALIIARTRFARYSPDR